MARMPGLPWPLTFSYSRALQNPPLKTWSGQSGDVAAAQRAFYPRARMNGLAAQGKYRPELEKQAAYNGFPALRVKSQEPEAAGSGQGPRYVCSGRRPLAHYHQRSAF